MTDTKHPEPEWWLHHKDGAELAWIMRNMDACVGIAPEAYHHGDLAALIAAANAKPTLPTRDAIAAKVDVLRQVHAPTSRDANGFIFAVADAVLALLKSDAADPGPSSVPGERCAYVFTGDEPCYLPLHKYKKGHVCSALREDHPLAGHDFIPPASPTPSPYACGERHPTMSDVYCVYGRGHTLEHHGGGENAATHWPVSPTPPPDLCGQWLPSLDYCCTQPEGHEGLHVGSGMRGAYGAWTNDGSFITDDPPAGPTPPPGDAAGSTRPDPRVLESAKALIAATNSDEICDIINGWNDGEGGFEDALAREVVRVAGPAPSVERFPPTCTCYHMLDIHAPERGKCQVCGCKAFIDLIPPATVAPSEDAMHVSNGYGDLLDACSDLYRAPWSDPGFATINSIYRCVRIIAEHAEATDRRFALIADAWDFPGTPDELRRRQQAFVDDVRGTGK